jgi:hypothetical protein
MAVRHHRLAVGGHAAQRRHFGPFENFLQPKQSFLQQKDLVVGEFSGDGRPDVLVESVVYRQLAPASGSTRRGPQATKPAPLTAAIEALRGPSAASPPGR